MKLSNGSKELNKQSINLNNKRIKTSPAKNHELVRLHLDIGQCRFIHRLISDKFIAMQVNGSVDINNAVEQLLHQFEREAYPSISTAIHKNDDLERYINSNDPDDINALLQDIAVEGALHVE